MENTLIAILKNTTFKALTLNSIHTYSTSTAFEYCNLKDGGTAKVPIHAEVVDVQFVHILQHCQFYYSVWYGRYPCVVYGTILDSGALLLCR